jgi:hypothetical protein
MKRRATIVVLVAAIVAVTAIAVTLTQRGTVAQESVATAEAQASTREVVDPPDWLRREARDMARVLGDPQPDAVYWGHVPVGSLGSLTGNEWPDPTKMTYIVVLQGRLSTHTISRPAGAHIPSHSPQAYALYQAETEGATGFGMYLGEGIPPAVPEGLYGLTL